MKRTEFIEKWKYQLSGLAIYGLVIDATAGPLAKATHACEIPKKVEELLGHLWADLQPPLPAPPSPAAKANPPAASNHPQTPPRR